MQDKQPRVTTERARDVFSKMKREGYMDVVIQVLEDYADTLDGKIRRANSSVLMKNIDDMCKYNARQGELAAVENMIRNFNALATGNAMPINPEAQ